MSKIERAVRILIIVCLAILAAVLITAAVLSRTTGENPAPSPSADIPTPSPPPEEEVTPEPVPVLTLADVRGVELADVTDEEAWADFARYTVHEVLLRRTEDDLFGPDELVTYLGLAEALADLSGEKAENNGLYQVSSPAGEGTDGETGTVWQTGPLTMMIPDGQEDVPVTRAQAAFYLHQYVLSLYDAHDEVESGILDYNGYLGDYTDGDSVPEQAAQSVSWALDQGLFAGMVSDTIYPDLPITRAQLAEVLVAFTAAATGEPVAVELAGRLEVPQVVSASQANHEELQAAIDSVAARYGAIGLQVAVVENGVVTDSFAYGWATRNEVPMTADHKLRVASITKVAVGMAAMNLLERGVVDLDESIGTYWGFPIANGLYPDSTVNLRALLSHTSSIIPYGDDTSRQREAIEARLRNGCFSNTQPGNIISWLYNNYAFSVLGMTLELASGEYLDDVMNNAFWDVMDIDAAFESGNIRQTDMLTTLYYYGGAVSRSVPAQAAYQRAEAPAMSASSFAGGLTISARDLAKMAALLANDGRFQGVPLLSGESVELMETRNEYQLSDGTYQALPLRCQDDLFGRERIYYHTGSAYGVFNCMSYDPDARDGVVVLSVGASGMKDDRNIYSVCSEISQTIYDTITH